MSRITLQELNPKYLGSDIEKIDLIGSTCSLRISSTVFLRFRGLDIHRCESLSDLHQRRPIEQNGYKEPRRIEADKIDPEVQSFWS